MREPGGPEELVMGEMETPEPGPGEVRIAVASAGVNRADILQRRGYYPPPKGISPILGLEVAGVVDKVGPTDGYAQSGESGTAGGSLLKESDFPSGASDSTTEPLPGASGVASPPVFRPGDPVVALLAGGGYAEYAVAPVGQCAPVPSSMNLVKAGGIMETAATVVSNFEHIGVLAGETILIHGGAGGIGSFAIPYAKQLGLHVITTVGNEAKAVRARAVGADVAVNYHGDWESEVRCATSGAGVDAILDIIGAKYLEPNVNLLARGGRMVVIGLQGGNKGTLDLNKLLTKAATITATSLRFRPVAEKVAIVHEVAEKVWPLFDSGTIPLPPITTFPLAKAREAHELLDSDSHMGKIVLTVGS